MTFSTKTISLSIGLSLAATLAFAAGHQKSPEQVAVEARQSHMNLYAFNLGRLGAMAKGDVPYDAAAAQGAADNLAALAAMDQSAYWLPGTDSGSVDGSRAMPELWDNIPDVIAKAQAFGEATVALQAAAGDQASLGAALGAVGGACGACHKAYRAPAN